MLTGSLPRYTLCVLSIETTRRCSVISLTECVLGTSSSMPDCRMGAVIMKMIRSTSTMSMNGTMLISEREVCVGLEREGISQKLETRSWKQKNSLAERFFNLGGHFQCECVKALSQIFYVLQELIVENHRGDSRRQAGGGGEQRFGDAGGDGAEAGSAGVAEAGESVNDAPDGAEQADERSDGAGGGQPGHAFFHAADFFGGGHLHVGGNRLETLEFWRMRIGGLAADLALQFAKAGGVDGGKRRTRGGQRLRIGNTARGAEDAKELIALAADAAEQAELLQDHGPGDDGEKKKQYEHAAGDPASVGENAAEVD